MFDIKTANLIKWKYINLTYDILLTVEPYTTVNFDVKTLNEHNEIEKKKKIIKIVEIQCLQLVGIFKPEYVKFLNELLQQCMISRTFLSKLIISCVANKCLHKSTLGIRVIPLSYKVGWTWSAIFKNKNTRLISFISMWRAHYQFFRHEGYNFFIEVWFFEISYFKVWEQILLKMFYDWHVKIIYINTNFEKISNHFQMMNK